MCSIILDYWCLEIRNNQIVETSSVHAASDLLSASDNIPIL